MQQQQQSDPARLMRRKTRVVYPEEPQRKQRPISTRLCSADSWTVVEVRSIIRTIRPTTHGLFSVHAIRVKFPMLGTTMSETDTSRISDLSRPLLLYSCIHSIDFTRLGPTSMPPTDRSHRPPLKGSTGWVGLLSRGHIALGIRVIYWQPCAPTEDKPAWWSWTVSRSCRSKPPRSRKEGVVVNGSPWQIISSDFWAVVRGAFRGFTAAVGRRTRRKSRHMFVGGCSDRRGRPTREDIECEISNLPMRTTSSKRIHHPRLPMMYQNPKSTDVHYSAIMSVARAAAVGVFRMKKMRPVSEWVMERLPYSVALLGTNLLIRRTHFTPSPTPWITNYRPVNRKQLRRAVGENVGPRD